MSTNRQQSHRRHSSLSSEYAYSFSPPMSPPRTLSIADSPASSQSQSPFPSFSDPFFRPQSGTKTQVSHLHTQKQKPSVSGATSPAGGNLVQLEELRYMLREQNSLLQRLAAKAAVVFEKRGEPIPEDFLAATRPASRPALGGNVNSGRCLSGSFTEQSRTGLGSAGGSANPKMRLGLSRRHSLAFTPVYADDFVEEPEDDCENLSTGDPALEDGQVANLQAMFYFKRVELAARPHDWSERPRFDPTQVTLEPAATSALLERSAGTNCATSEWKYYVPAFVTPSDGWMQAEHGSIPVVGGWSNYVPPWELSVEADGTVYHIDDVDRCSPLDQPDLAEFETHEVPYAFSAPYPVRLHGRSRLAKTGLGVRPDRLRAAIGTLFATPPDGRFPLPFERNELRLLGDTGGMVEAYLEEAAGALERLERNRGVFCVRDITCWMRTCDYGREGVDVDGDVDYPPQWLAAGPAVRAEQAGFMVPPTPHYVVTAARLPVLERARQWYRLVYACGLERGGLAEADAGWRALLRPDHEAGRVAPSRRVAIQHTFDRYLAAQSQSWASLGRMAEQDQERFAKSWAPLVLSWVSLDQSDVESGPVGRFRAGNVALRRHAVSMLMLPHTPSHEAECFAGPDSERKTAEFADKGMDYWTCLVLTSLPLDTERFRAPYSVVLETAERAMMQAVTAWEQISETVFEPEWQPRDSSKDDPDINRTEVSDPDDAPFEDASADVEPDRPGFVLPRPELELSPSDLAGLGSAIAAVTTEWRAFRSARLPLLRAHEAVFRSRHGDSLGRLDPELQVLDELVDAIAGRIDLMMDRLAVIQTQFERAVHLAVFEACRARAGAERMPMHGLVPGMVSSELITLPSGSLVSAGRPMGPGQMLGVSDAEAALVPVCLTYLHYEIGKMADLFGRLSGEKSRSLAVVALLTVSSVAVSFATGFSAVA